MPALRQRASPRGQCTRRQAQQASGAADRPTRAGCCTRLPPRLARPAAMEGGGGHGCCQRTLAPGEERPAVAAPVLCSRAHCWNPPASNWLLSKADYIYTPRHPGCAGEVGSENGGLLCGGEGGVLPLLLRARAAGGGRRGGAAPDGALPGCPGAWGGAARAVARRAKCSNAAAHWPMAEVDTTRLMPTPSSTTIRPAHASSPLVPSLYESPDSDQVSGV